MNQLFEIYLVQIAVFFAVVLMVEGVYLFWQATQAEGRARVRQRVRALSAGGEHGEEVEDLLLRRELSDNPTLDRLLARVPRIHLLDRLLQRTGRDWSIARFVGAQLLLTLLVAGIGLVLLPGPALAVLLGLAAGLTLPYLYAKRLERRRQAKFVEYLPDTLDFLARSLRAGNPFSASLRLVSKEMPEPVAGEFGITFDEMNYGLSLEDALHNLGERVGSPELRYFITAVTLQRATGGNLADLLNRLADIMRARVRVYRSVLVNAAEMRLSAWVLTALPFVVALAISIFNPDYLGILLERPVGRTLIVIQLLLMAVGYWIMRRMIRFHI